MARKSKRKESDARAGSGLRSTAGAQSVRSGSGLRSTAGAGRPRRTGKESPAHDAIIYRIGILRRLLDRYSAPRLTQQSGLLVAEWRVLTNLYPESPATASALRRRSYADRAEVSRACASLIKKGLITRKD